MNDWGIRSRVILLAIIPTGLVALVMGAYFVAARVQDLNVNVQDRGMTIANYLAQTSEYSLLSRNSRTLSRLVTSARDGDDDILAVAIFAKNNLLLSSSGTKELVSQLSQAANKPLLQTSIEKTNDGFLVRSPIVSQPTISRHDNEGSISELPVIGYVAVLITDKNIQLRQYQTLVTAFIILLIGLILGGILAQNMARNITIPIIQLANAVKRIKEGQLKVAIKAKTSGELRTLVDGFNDMSDSLYEAREEMQMAIEQATADINATATSLEEQNVKLNMAKKEAVEASRVKSEFLANMSHEIRTPMNGVIGFTNLLLRSKLTTKQKDYLSTIKKSANGLLSIIDNILDFSKIEAGKMEIEKRSFCIGDCVDETLNLLAPAAQAKNIEILGIVYQDVPKLLLGDAGRISQILTNLCNNAIKFTQQGTIQIRVMLEEEYSKSVRLRINISDTGVGLTKEQQKVLFQAFTQADTTTTRRFGGTGLGLVISKKLAESMKGKIGLESEENVGSTFWFTLELDKDLKTSAKTRLGFPGRRILFHDSNKVSQLATKYLLEQWGTLVESSDDLPELISMAEAYQKQKKDVHLILTGGYSPDDNKKELLILKGIAEKLNAPLAILINSKEEKNIQQFTELGLNRYLSKPVTKKPFYGALMHWFNINENLPDNKEPLVSQPAETGKPKILCVDDNPANLKLIEAFLSDFSVEIQLASNGRQAVDRCKETEFDLIFMDIQMPDMDGLEATQFIRCTSHYYKSSPIIALTAHAMKGEKNRLLQQGMDDYLTKPINQNQLRESIQKWTGKNVSLESENLSLNDVSPTKTQEISIDWPLSLKNAGGKDDLAREMLKMLIDSFSEARELIQDNLASGKVEQLTAQIHKLHGATAYCGVPELKSLANQYESLLKTSGIDQMLHELNDKFLDELDRVENDAATILD